MSAKAALEHPYFKYALQCNLHYPALVCTLGNVTSLQFLALNPELL